jgi:hypothetical protein
VWRNGLGSVSIGGNLVGAVSNLGVDGGDVNLVGLVWHLLLNERPPGLMGSLDDLVGVGLVLGLPVESELVLWLAIRDLVDTEPLLSGLEESWHLLLHILNVVELRGKRVSDINGNHLPVSLALIKESKAAKNLNLPDLTGLGNGVSNFAHINWITITIGLGVSISVAWIFPSLHIQSSKVTRRELDNKKKKRRKRKKKKRKKKEREESCR